MTRARLALIVLTLALLAPSSASAAWLPIEDLGDIEFTDSEHVFAANDRGDAVAVWKDGRGIQVAVSRRGAAFGPARVVAGGEGMVWDVGVLLNEDGRALIHWRRFVTATKQRIYVAGLKVDGGFGTTRRVTPAAEYLWFEPAIGPGGRFSFTYATDSANGQPKPMYARSAPPSGRLGPRRTIATSAITVREMWYVGTRPYVAFTRNGDRHTKLFERRIDPLSRARQIAQIPANGILQLDTASNGTQAAVWTTGNTEGPKRPLVAAVRRAGGVFRGQEIDDRLPPQVMDVAVARSGAALVAWREFNSSTTEDTPSPPGQTDKPGEIVTSYRAPGGSFRATRAFRPDPEPAEIDGINMDIESGGLAALAFGAVRYAGIQGRPYVAVMDEGRDPEITPLGEIGGMTGGASVAIDERDRTVAIFRDDDRMRAMRGDFGR
jgi:hypothetical protein